MTSTRRIRVDLHIHTTTSRDGVLHPRVLERRARQCGIDVVAITDHDEIAGAVWAQDHLGLRVIVGEEVRTVQGEMIGLFLRERIPPGLDLGETIERIRAQAGVVYFPHPFAGHRAGGVAAVDVEHTGRIADVVETFNARNLLGLQDRRAAALAQRLGKPAGAGSDAHGPAEFGGTYVEMDDFEGPSDFLAKLHGGRIVGARLSLARRLHTAALRRMAGL